MVNIWNNDPNSSEKIYAYGQLSNVSWYQKHV